MHQDSYQRQRLQSSVKGDVVAIPNEATATKR